jgi:hypothetical protein
MLSNSRVIDERSIIIPTSKNLSTSMKEFRNNNQGEYSLKQNFFDPSKSSPPNEFMIKLYMRMSRYTPLHIKVDNRESE